ncbi:MAG: helix-turn-helix domain-containing protein [Anaerolineae bacterium]|nr:helix-turn-helix domain-containing protein [Anaerolineae bacterium]
MTDRDIGLEILEGIREIKAFKRGEIEGLRTRELRQPAPPDEIRARMGLSQAAFAGLMGVSVRTVQDWEQGRREPSGPAKSLLRVAEKYPAVFLDLA